MAIDREKKRAELIDACVDYVLENGLAGLSLRPLAAHLDTSDRMLIYNFGSKDELIAAVVVRTFERLAQLIAARLTAPARDPGVVVRQLWEALSAPESQGYVRLFFEVYGLSFPQPDLYRPIISRIVESWLDLIATLLIRAGTPKARAGRTAASAVATVEGLLLAHHALGDDPRIEMALRDLQRAARETKSS